MVPVDRRQRMGESVPLLAPGAVADVVIACGISRDGC
jgi:hypothetical protein